MPHGTEVTDTFSGRMVQHNWDVILGRHPHPAPETMLLNVGLLKGPTIKDIIGILFSPFFKSHAAIEDRRWQSQTEVF
jgi:hypothetical protein